MFSQQKLGSLNNESALPSTSYLPATPSMVPSSSYIPSSETQQGETPHLHFHPAFLFLSFLTSLILLTSKCSAEYRTNPTFRNKSEANVLV